jgi:hypothetical protein
MKKEISKFRQTQIRAEVLEGIYKKLEDDLESTASHYAKTGTQHQDYKWENHDKILLWEDEEQTIPKMADDYDYIPYTEEELEEYPEIGAKAEVIKQIMKELEKLL